MEDRFRHCELIVGLQEQGRWPPAVAGRGEGGGGGGGNLPSLPRPLLSGLVWHQTSGLFSRWKEVFLILTKDCLRSEFFYSAERIHFLPCRCHKIAGSAKTAQFGGALWSLDLVLMSDVRFVERRGYLTLCLEAQGITRTYLRRTDGIRNGG